MVEKKQEPAGRARAGRLTVRRERAPYQAAALQRATRVQESIDAALAQARRTREEIEARIDSLWNSPRPAPRPASPRRRRAPRARRT